MSHNLLRTFIACTLFAVSSTALSWGSAGHRLTGEIAQKELQKNAGVEVKRILGDKLTLGDVAPWADCVRGVTADFRYAPDPKFRDGSCDRFEKTQEEQDRIIDYARRSWERCAKKYECHKEYHFVNVAIQHDEYDRKWIGTGPDDLVSAINASVAYLSHKEVPEPFQFKDEREALMLLVHYVGDLHQPMHVGSLYLDSDSHAFDPDARGTKVAKSEKTIGGNSLKFPIEDGREFSVHKVWDDLPKALKWPTPEKRKELENAAKALKRTSGPRHDWAKVWARESLKLAKPKLTNLTLHGGGGGWTVDAPSRADYDASLVADKQSQLIAGGAHLAQLLNSIWR